MIRPVHYKVHIEPDLSAFRFEGEIEIDYEFEDKTSKVRVNAKELAIKRVELGGKELAFSLDQGKEELSIDLGKPMTGEAKIRISYTGEINDKLAGLYRSRYVVDGEERFAAVTQFQESDARRAFPCVDSPGSKATFDISFLVDMNLDTIANTPIKSVEEKGGKKLVVFETTPKMSTYLLFFGIGEWEQIETHVNNKKVTVTASPGKAKKHGEFALDFAAKSLEFCEDYFGVEHPIPKVDHIATTDFLHGAMENWGAILYRENLLLHYPGITSKVAETSIQMVIAHEMTHAWFGNLVSPETWKYLWLNESFATFFGFGIVAHYYPEKRVWETFVRVETLGALSADAKHHTAPIERPGDGAVGMTVTNAPILYNKGGSVLRQVEAYVGKDNFKSGLRKYLSTYQFGNATSNNLWESLEEVSGLPVNRMMESWVMQEGYPVLRVSASNGKITVSQKRFTFLPNESENVWIVPLIITDLRNHERYNFSFETSEAEYEVDTDLFFVNEDQVGFYRVRYDDAYYSDLSKLIREQRLSAISRWSVENDAYAFLRSGDMTLGQYLDILMFYEDETMDLPLYGIANHIMSLANTLEGKAREKLASKAVMFLEGILDRIGYGPQEGEDHGIASVRSTLLLAAEDLGSQKTIEFLLKSFEKYKKGDSISPDILGAVIRTGAKHTNDFDYFLGKFEKAENEVIKIHMIQALASFSDEGLVEKMEELVFSKVPFRNRGYSIATLCGNKVTKDSVWHWFLANLDSFEALPPYTFQNALVNIIPTSEKHEDDMREFFKDYVKKNKVAKEAVDIGLEYLEIKKQLKAHTA